MLILGDCIEKLKELKENSVDAVVTDPPAGISFMGKDWDKDKGGRDNWIKWMQEIAEECKRVLKPGGHCLVWAIPRTSHWTATDWENAGFEIRDVVAHIFGSGFPKSLNIGKKIDQLQGNEREDLGEYDPRSLQDGANRQDRAIGGQQVAPSETSKLRLTKGTSEWEGWGTALKPAREDWILMRKPLSEKTVADNCLRWGTGGINIDQTRIGGTDTRSKTSGAIKGSGWGTKGGVIAGSKLGRFPANLLHDGSDEVVELFPDTVPTSYATNKTVKGGMFNYPGHGTEKIKDETRSAARYFYCAKASKKERNMGCEGLEEKETRGGDGRVEQGYDRTDPEQERLRKVATAYGAVKAKKSNTHPTVKPIALMEYLVKLVSRENATVLDPFCGSGTTGMACKKLKRKFIGIEKEKDYFKIAEARIKAIPTPML